MRHRVCALAAALRLARPEVHDGGTTTVWRDCPEHDVGACLNGGRIQCPVPKQRSGVSGVAGPAWRCACGASWYGPLCEHDVDECAAALSQGVALCGRALRCRNTRGAYECDVCS